LPILPPIRRSVIFVDTDKLPARELRRGSLIENEIEAKLVYQVSLLPHDFTPDCLLLYSTGFFENRLLQL
jgi:hypothetical protein